MNLCVVCDGGDVVWGLVVVLRERFVLRFLVRFAFEIFAFLCLFYYFKFI